MLTNLTHCSKVIMIAFLLINDTRALAPRRNIDSFMNELHEFAKATIAVVKNNSKKTEGLPMSIRVF